MPTCEKCWSEAGVIAFSAQTDKVGEYSKLINARREHPCTPEEQAGTDATPCPNCKRLTIHQHARICMACGHDERPKDWR